ncbi:very-long-chain 3-oxoacyl-CoA reductase [Elysia marginata]|uniref:Very-long-chain 3-oxoacyl-CoA reductase n=1 Tax=Elysia marginata TaxID=1093978 RepID=A0AAV4IXX2_9GAST|nr:very-long-chain 3-oxoacyl-CoA reductase [Elysia marginata]
MFQEYLAGSADVFSAIGALTTGVVAFKVTLGLFRFISAHFLSGALGLSANLRKAGAWAVVTGCTDGIGKAYAEQLAARGINIVLISRTLSKLTEMAKEVEEKYKVKTMVIAADFSQADIYDNIRSNVENLDIGVLVNNVGMSYDYPEYYAEIEDPNFVSKMLHLNCTSVAKMTQIVLPNMLKKRQGYVINIGSSAGSAPTPFLTLYSACKSFVDTFTRALTIEYSRSGVNFQLVSPYFVVSKLSKIRKASVFVPTPNTYVKGALATVGVQSSTNGFWSHTVQDWIRSVIPMSVIVNGLLDNRRRALKKRADAKQNQ